MNRCLVVLSGGLDSTVLLNEAVKGFGNGDVGALTFTYGANHNRSELECAKWQAEHYSVPHYILDVSPIFQFDEKSALLGHADVPFTDYDTLVKEGIKVTYVPQRNLVLLSIASSIALQKGYDLIWYGMHLGDDREVYPDCTPEFVKAASEAIRLGSDGKVIFEAPFIENMWNKNQIALRAMQEKVDIDHTWSCYYGGVNPCGKCPACLQRKEALSWACENM